MILLRLKFHEKIKRSTFWTFNSSLLKDKAYLDEINEEITNVKQEYAVSPYAGEALDNVPLVDLQLSIPDDLSLDCLLMKIRSKTISYTTTKKRRTNEEQHALQQDMQLLEKNME
eukprot:TRINITY_DN44874_c0_g2_i1.p1 TRINITY_DN44874_c0_g2~~TRINITY_DN44874_c0_g2_i1.p1  ORF type:complete len:115 (+),score=10.40 TRINITY_DN44874_c0_g2_i1:235-579(+)